MVLLALRTVRARRASLAGAFVAVMLAVALTTACAVLMAAALRAPGPGRFAAPDAVVTAHSKIWIGYAAQQYTGVFPAPHRYHREWIARRRAEFFGDKACIDCGSTKQLELDRRDTAEAVNHRLWSWSADRRDAELAKYEVRCSSCRRRRLAAEQMRQGTRGRYEKGCRCDACKAAKARRNKKYRENHRDELAAKQRALPKKPRVARTPSGTIGVYYAPTSSRAKPWRATIGVDKRLIHLGLFATKEEAAAARRAAERELRPS
jgi:hypothetical protein